MSHHKFYSEFVFVIQYKVSIGSVLYKFEIHAKNSEDLVSKLESSQQDRVSKNQNNMVKNERYQVKPITSYSCKLTCTHTR